ncbi:MAG TPA: phosphopantothenoylcysteine decarboxylase [Bdellovibrionota bacterium]|nr:phosphopantothenoylcysteine decarboxylase [Bdellovibrionota bacterium]
MNILVTAGATREPIDGVRFISNFSTGKTGARLSDELIQQGNHVVYVCGADSEIPQRSCEVMRFGSSFELDTILRNLLQQRNFDCVIHLAAVADFSVEAIEIEGHRFAAGIIRKIDSEGRVILHLKPNFKIVEKLKGYVASRKIAVIAFKLTNIPIEAGDGDSSSGESREALQMKAITKLLSGAKVDYVVHNDFADIQAGSQHFGIYGQRQKIKDCDTPESLARELMNELKKSA